MTFELVVDLAVTAAKSQSILVSRMTSGEVAELETDIRERFTDGKLATPLWHGLVDEWSEFDEFGWRRVGDLAGEGTVSMLISDIGCNTGLVVESGMDLTTLLMELHGFVFYVVNAERTRLWAFNDHDFLIYCEAQLKDKERVWGMSR